VPPRRWSLQAYLGLLVAVFLLTAVAAVVYVVVQSGRDARESARRDTRYAAETTAGELGRGLAGLRATVRQAAGTPGIEDMVVHAVPGCRLAFVGSGGIESGHLDAIDRSGAVTCSSRSPAPASYAGAPWLARAQRSELLMAPVRDAAAGGHALLISAPVAGGAFVAFVALEPTGEGLARLFGGGRELEFLITDAPGRTVLVRSIDPKRWVGRGLAGASFSPTSTTTERTDVDGTTRIYAEATVPGVGWRLFVGEDRAQALAAASRLRNRQVLIILAGLALLLATTGFVHRRITGPVRRLGLAVRASGAPAAPEPVEVAGPVEVVELATDINGLIAAVARELEDRRRAEASARAAARNYRLIFEGSPVPMWIHDAETGIILAANDAAVAGYGYAREELVGLDVAAIELPEPEAVEDVPPGLPGDGARPGRHRRRDGSELEVRTLRHDVAFESRRACIVMAADVTERERLEAQLRQAQRMEAIGRLAGGIAHDFNNLLTAILGNTELLLHRMAPDDPRRGEADEVRKAGERAVALTRQLLTFGRVQSAEPVELDLRDTIRGVEPMLRRLIRAAVEIVVDLPAVPARVRADQGQLEQVLVNLAVNAGDAMPGGGTLTITVREVAAGVELVVADTGIGMDEATLAQIFEPFFTTKGPEEGTGLGLATVYGIVRQNGGELRADSAPGRGTTFTIVLPHADREPPLAPAPSTDAAKRFSRRRPPSATRPAR
jgi:PAS domain S-box-containing protein